MNRADIPMAMNPEAYLERLRETVRFLKRRGGKAPRVALVLGSGLGDFLGEMGTLRAFPYSEIPHFPVSAVAGHAGRFVLAAHGDVHFAALQGRVHFYEGWPLHEVVFTVRALALWGVETFIVTNAAGGIHTQFQPGDLMLIRDHLNLMGGNPLEGPNLGPLGERFPDLTEAYDWSLLQLARRCGEETGTPLQQGVYAALRGPSYETPAEIRMLRTLGADAVGMSTVPEVIALNHMGRRVLGISCICNPAAGMSPRRMDHREILRVTARVRSRFAALLFKVLERRWGAERAERVGSRPPGRAGG